ncbi:glycosyltransferase [Conexibacter woesei]|uniref:glycosyltransferase n=1 Tax=Conexibacter woesei TaxID=191495 RepID=UPI00041953A1|nr:glycosyltransferase [Conexibacter woesei]
MSLRLWIVTPVYLDVPSFLMLREHVLRAIQEEPALPPLTVQFVVADDTGGLDPEMEQVDQLDDVRIIEPPFNLGHQRAIVYALRTVAGDMDDEDLVVTMDADGEDAPSDVPRLLIELIAAQSDRTLVLALRSQRSESHTFRLFYRLFRAGFKIATGTVVRSGNFAAYHGWFARRVLAHPNFDLCYSSTLTSLQLDTRAVECDRSTRYAGQSRMSFSKLVRHGVSMLMPYLDRIAIRAMIAFSVVIGVCTVLGIAVVANKLFTSYATPGWATTALLGLGISSLLALGNFVVLFAVYSQSRGLSLSDLEHQDHGSTRHPSSAPDRTPL